MAITPIQVDPLNHIHIVRSTFCSLRKIMPGRLDPEVVCMGNEALHSARKR